MMRIGKLVGTFVAACATVFMVTAAQADDEFDVAVSGGQIVVTAKGEWHVNKNYPWKLVVGDQKIDKSKFNFTERSATLASAPKGAGKLKGGVCSGDKCKNFEKDVTVQ
jgi:hypothetical protein